MEVREIRISYKTGPKIPASQKIMNAENVHNLSKQIIENDTQENFIVLLLNNKNFVISFYRASLGTVNEAAVHPRDVFKAAIMANASGIIVVHNHPSGDCDPSKEDITTTKRLLDAGKLVGIPIIDHVIVSNCEYYSFSHNNLI